MHRAAECSGSGDFVCSAIFEIVAALAINHSDSMQQPPSAPSRSD